MKPGSIVSRNQTQLQTTPRVGGNLDTNSDFPFRETAVNWISSSTLWSSAHPLEQCASFPTAELNGLMSWYLFVGGEAGNNKQWFHLFLWVTKNVLGPSLETCIKRLGPSCDMRLLLSNCCWRSVQSAAREKSSKYLFMFQAGEMY